MIYLVIFCFILLVTVPRAPITTGVVLTFCKFQHFWSSMPRSLYLVIFSASFRIMFRHTGTAISIMWHSLVFSSCTIMSGLLCPTFLSVSMYMSHSILIPSFVVVSLGTCVIHDLGTSIPRSHNIFQCIYLQIWLCPCRYCIPQRILHPDTMWWTVSSFFLHSRHFPSVPFPILLLLGRWYEWTLHHSRLWLQLIKMQKDAKTLTFKCTYICYRNST